MIAANPEFPESEYFVFRVTTRFERTEDQKPNQFCVKEIKLLDAGWVLVTSHEDYPEECFPPWRVIILEGLDAE
jgi:hypothetical protein